MFARQAVSGAVRHAPLRFQRTRIPRICRSQSSYLGTAAASSYDVIVVGVGALGSSALYHCARLGLKVLGLEQFQVAHNLGSSHGETRIIRLAYHESPLYVPVLRRSYQLWDELQQQTGQTLLTITGGLDIGARAAAGALEAARYHGLDHEVLSGAEVNARFPGYRVPDDMPAVFSPDAGVLRPEACILAHCQEAKAHRAQLREGERVVSWRVLPGGSVEVQSDKGQTYSAGSLVFTAGPWLPHLVPALKAVCEVERQVVGWFRISDPPSFLPSAFPVFVLMEEDEDGGGAYYGFPDADGTGFKIGKYNHLGGQCDPDFVDRNLHPADEAALRRAVERYFPKAAGELLRHSACMFTNTPDGHFIIDSHPAAPQVLLCSACSGHGFKMSSAIGEALAQMAAGQASTLSGALQLHRIDPAHREGHQALVSSCLDEPLRGQA